MSERIGDHIKSEIDGYRRRIAELEADLQDQMKLALSACADRDAALRDGGATGLEIDLIDSLTHERDRIKVEIDGYRRRIAELEADLQDQMKLALSACAERDAALAVIEAVRGSVPDGLDDLGRYMTSGHKSFLHEARAAFGRALLSDSPTPSPSWTATPPESPGWYWARHIDRTQNPPIPFAPHVVDLDWEDTCDGKQLGTWYGDDLVLAGEIGEWHPVPLTPPGGGEGE